MICYTTQKNRTVPSTPYRIHTWWCFLSTMMVLVLSACSEPKTENGGNTDDGKTARVTFTMNGGTPPIPKQIVVTETKATKPLPPARSGYVFDEWYIDKELGSVFNFETAITDNTILYAKWDAILSLAGIIDSGTIPSDLSPYNTIVRTILAPYASGAKIVARYVTVAGGRNKDGSAWEHAKAGTDLRTTLQGIVDASSDKVYLLLIGSGEYKANADAAEDKAFLAMKNHVAIVGGWDSWTRTADTRTILSGNDTRPVFVNVSIDNTALLYGVKITKGKSKDGGGMYNSSSSPVLMNVTFSRNTAQYGGGMYNVESSSPVLTNVTFSRNTAIYGGGIYNYNASSPVLTNVTFSGNTASDGGGGGMNNYNASSPVLTNVTFSGNTAKYGGGMYNSDSSPTIVNSMFWGNTATARAGPQIYASGDSTITFAYSVIDRGRYNHGIMLVSIGPDKSPRAVVIAPEYIDPSLNTLANNGGFVFTHAIVIGSSAADIGLYVRRKDSTFYYSTDKITWYTGFNSDGLTGTIALPRGAIDLTATDATGTARIGRPDAGAYEAR